MERELPIALVQHSSDPGVNRSLGGRDLDLRVCEVQALYCQFLSKWSASNSEQCIELKGKTFVKGHAAILLQISPVQAAECARYFSANQKSILFSKGGLIVSQLGKNGEVLAVLQGPWKASGGGGLAFEHEAEG